ncbi:hypothetical protein SEHO0A_04284 [Salmonella enterica subsp. houtenae str. ATCC BAA-1581]|nr:hypothetical protein SEHO0A_04284 [Salmonella enterica subsp. houtenae str. ATCC BAA-1581]
MPFSSLNSLNNFADYTCNFSGYTRWQIWPDVTFSDRALCL